MIVPLGGFGQLAHSMDQLDQRCALIRVRPHLRRPPIGGRIVVASTLRRMHDPLGMQTRFGGGWVFVRASLGTLGIALGSIACASIGEGEGSDPRSDGDTRSDGAPQDLTDGSALDGSVPTADAAPCLPGSFQLLANPAFDEGAVDWTEVGGPINYPDSQIPIDVHSGTRAALLGRPAQAEQRLSQMVTIPIGTVSLTWSGYTCFVTARTDPSTDDVKIQFLDGTTVVESLAAFGDEDATSVCNWAERSAAAAPHAGEQLEFAMSAHSDNGVLSSFYFDTLALTAVVECP